MSTVVNHLCFMTYTKFILALCTVRNSTRLKRVEISHSDLFESDVGKLKKRDICLKKLRGFTLEIWFLLIRCLF